MINLFMAIFFGTLAFACIDPYFFIGYLISIAFFGLYQAVFMANAGGAWDNARRWLRSTSARRDRIARGRSCRGHGRRSVQGHLLGGHEPDHQVHDAVRLLAIEIAITLPRETNTILAIAFYAVSVFFVVKSFNDMRIIADKK